MEEEASGNSVGPLLQEGLGDIGTGGDGTGMVYLSLSLPNQGIGFIEEISPLQYLQSMDLGGNQLVDSQMVHLDNLPYLLNLNLSDNRLARFPDLKATVNLKSVDLSRNRLRSLNCARHRFIKNLIVDDNQLTSLGGLAHSRCLMNVSACQNQLTSVAEMGELCEPSTLQRLLVSQNPIEAVTGLEVLESLVLVDFSETQIGSMKGLDNHPLLADIFASASLVEGELDDEIALLQTLPLLRTLYLQGNGIAESEAYRHRILYNLATILDLDGVQVMSEEKVAAQNFHGDNAESLAATSAKYFPPGNPCDVELFPGEFEQ